MSSNQTECHRLKQKSVMKFLLGEYKSCEIYRTCEVYKERCFSKNKILQIG